MKVLFFLFICLTFISCSNSNPKEKKEEFTPTFTFTQEYRVYGKGI